MALFTRDRPTEDHHAARGFTAAARVVDLSDEAEKRRIKKGPQAWQSTAWRWFDEVGEVSNAGNWIGNGMSRLRLTPALVAEPGQAPTMLRDPDEDDPLPPDITPDEYEICKSQLQRLRGSDGGHSELNRLGGLNMWVAGECNLLGMADEDGQEIFDVLSVDELVADPNGASHGRSGYLRRTEPSFGAQPDDQNTIPIPVDAFVCRVWRRHPRYSKWPNSGMRAANSMCESLYKFTAEMNAISESRVPMGMLAFPNTMDFGPSDPTDETEDGTAVATDPLTRDLLHHFEAPIRDPRSASRLVPFLVTGDPADIEKIRYIDLSKTTDTDLQQRIDSTIVRLATSLELPTEVLTGKANLNHWTAWTIDEEAFKFYLEPLAITWVMGLTVGYYRTMLRLAGLENVNRFCIWYDATELVSHPDDIDTVLKVDTQRPSLISDAAIRRTANIPEDDAPDEDEVARRIAMIQAQHARTTIQETPEQLLDEASGQTPDGTTPVEGPPPAGPPQPATQPAQPAKQNLTAAATGRAHGARLGRIEQATFLRVRQAANDTTRRALERAGARLRSLAAKNGLSAQVKDVDVLDIGGVLGPALVAQLADSATDLLDGAFAGMAGDWANWTRDAQRRALATLGIDPADHLDDDTLTVARDHGWDVLTAGLTTLAATLLYQPNQPAPQHGEYDDTTLVTGNIIRDALAAAGGGPTEDGAGSLLFGGAMTEIMSVHDLAPQGYVWVYGDEYRKFEFEGHLQLEDVEFASWDDDVLAASGDDDWVGEFYAPQDHDGCLCGFYRNVVDATDTSQEDEEEAA